MANSAYNTTVYDLEKKAILHANTNINESSISVIINDKTFSSPDMLKKAYPNAAIVSSDPFINATLVDKGFSVAAFSYLLSAITPSGKERLTLLVVDGNCFVVVPKKNVIVDSPEELDNLYNGRIVFFKGELSALTLLKQAKYAVGKKMLLSVTDFSTNNKLSASATTYDDNNLFIEIDGHIFRSAAEFKSVFPNALISTINQELNDLLITQNYAPSGITTKRVDILTNNNSKIRVYANFTEDNKVFIQHKSGIFTSPESLEEKYPGYNIVVGDRVFINRLLTAGFKASYYDFKRKMLNLSIPEPLLERIKEYAANNCTSNEKFKPNVSRTVETILTDFFDKLDNQ